MQEGLCELSQQNFAGVFAEAKAKLPKADVAMFKGVTTKIGTDGDVVMTDDQIRGTLVSLRYHNPICDACCKKGEGVVLKLCSACKLTFYCSQKCQNAHSEKHAERCWKTNGPLDEGPQKLVFLPINKPRSD